MILTSVFSPKKKTRFVLLVCFYSCMYRLERILIYKSVEANVVIACCMTDIAHILFSYEVL